MDISKVLDDAKSALNIDTDYKLAKALELPNGYITLWRQGSRIPDAYNGEERGAPNLLEEGGGKNGSRGGGRFFRDRPTRGNGAL